MGTDLLRASLCLFSSKSASGREFVVSSQTKLALRKNNPLSARFGRGGGATWHG